MGALQSQLVFSKKMPLAKEVEVESLKIIVKGLSATERRLLAATIKLSERRKPKLEVIPEGMIDIVDVIIIDAKDAEAVEWSNKFSEQLKKMTVIWVDASPRNKRHGSISRPVLWVNLPIIISRIMDEVSVLDLKENESVDSLKQPDVSPVSAATGVNHILVVDDSPSIREHLTNLLESRGNKVTAVDCGEAAVEVVERQSFDCVFMDVMMPGMNGYDACKKIKSKKVNGRVLPVIMLTGKSSPFDRIRGKMAGCNAYLTKPTKVDKLINVLGKAVKANA